MYTTQKYDIQMFKVEQITNSCQAASEKQEIGGVE